MTVEYFGIFYVKSMSTKELMFNRHNGLCTNAQGGFVDKQIERNRNRPFEDILDGHHHNVCSAVFDGIDDGCV